MHLPAISNVPFSSPASRNRRREEAFSLVEVVLAIGVVAFAFVSIFALLPTGLTTFRQAMDTSVCAQIVQRIVGDAQETDFDTLLASATSAGGTGSQYYALPIRFFDDQGTEVLVNEKEKSLYTVRVRGSMPGKADPSQHQNSWFTSLPSSQAFNPRDATFLTIQIANNPALKNLDSMVDSNNFLITAANASKEKLAVQTFSVVVARNGYKKP